MEYLMLSVSNVANVTLGRPFSGSKVSCERHAIQLKIDSFLFNID